MGINPEKVLNISKPHRVGYTQASFLSFMTRMKRCLLVGAGGMGRDTMTWATHIDQSEWRVAGFLDQNPNALAGKDSAYTILGDSWTWQPSEDEVFVCTLGDPASRMRVIADLRGRGATFVNVIHPSVIMAHNVSIGNGCIVAPYTVFGANSRVADYVMVNMASTLGHDSRTGEGTTISCQCDIMGYATIGIQCFLGGNSSVLPSRTVGDYAIVGAGSAVVHDVAPGTTVGGVPARPLIRRLPDGENSRR